ncbi:MAG: hypothetical protein Fur0010_15320 [Bdellovibrio sp.]
MPEQVGNNWDERLDTPWFTTYYEGFISNTEFDLNDNSVSDFTEIGIINGL